MAGSRRARGSTSALKWDSQNKQSNVGKKPLPDPTSVPQVLLMICLHVCRKVVLMEPDIKVSVYLGALLFGSLVCDFLPLPRSFFSRKDNFLNQYFVKLGWAWTLVVVGVYLGLSSWIYCCGNKVQVRKHMCRLAVGTVVWFTCTNLFVLLESATGRCTVDKFSTRASCVKHGQRWFGFDISGHSFLLIYCNLLIMEEAKSMRGWERIGELIMYEEYDEDSPLKNVNEEELATLKEHYFLFTPYVRLAFVALTGLAILWDVMLVSTIIYFHTMVQKVSGGLVAVIAWFITYKVWFGSECSPGLPGQGLFKYSDVKARVSGLKAHS